MGGVGGGSGLRLPGRGRGTCARPLSPAFSFRGSELQGSVSAKGSGHELGSASSPVTAHKEERGSPPRTSREPLWADVASSCP